MRIVQFRPFVYDATNQQVPVAIKPIEPQDAATTIKEPRQQTDWTSEYISNSKFDIYGLKTWAGELVALDAKTPELARHYERETAKQTMTAKPVRVFLTQRFPLDPHFDPCEKLTAKRKSHPTGTEFSVGGSMLLPKYSLIAYSSEKHNDFYAAES